VKKTVNHSHTNGQARVHPEQRPTIIDTHAEPAPAPAPVGPSQIPANGDAVDAVEATLWLAALQGVGPAVELAGRLPPGAVRDVLLNTLPDEWRDSGAFGLLQRLTDQDAAMLLAWLCRQWWDAYGLGQSHHEVGEDLRGENAHT
jgi:hypothetical protein